MNSDSSMRAHRGDEVTVSTEQTGSEVRVRMDYRGVSLENRYEIIGLLGTGSYGDVWTATDNRTDRNVAVKIMELDRNEGPIAKGYMGSRVASREVEVLKELNRLDTLRVSLFTQLLNVVEGEKVVCMIMEQYAYSLHQFLKMNFYIPFPSSQAVQISKQLLAAVAFIHKSGFVHTDIKPENIMFVSGHYDRLPYTFTDRMRRRGGKEIHYQKVLTRTDIRLIDFGMALNHKETELVGTRGMGTRQYRAPEMLIATGWGSPVDIWALACTLMEVWTGEMPFLGVTHVAQHLYKMENALGNMPNRLLRACPHEYLELKENLRRENLRCGRVAQEVGAPGRKLADYFDQEDRLHSMMVRVISGMMDFEDEARWTAEMALTTPLFKRRTD